MTFSVRIGFESGRDMSWEGLSHTAANVLAVHTIRLVKAGQYEFASRPVDISVIDEQPCVGTPVVWQHTF